MTTIEKAIPNISKSKYTAGLQCLKRQYLQIYQPQLNTQDTTHVMTEGTTVGAVARRMFPHGVLVDTDNRKFDEAVARTAELCSDPEVLAVFEAAFQYEHLRIRVDVLCRVGEGWKIGIVPDKELDYLVGEVKSSTKVKPQHCDDISFQVYVLRKLGMTVVDSVIVILNADYVYNGGVHNLTKLFKLEVVRPKPDAEIDGELHKQFSALAQPAPPEISCGSQCKSPHVCEFLDHCRPYVPGSTPNEMGMAAAKPLHYPLHFLDFETVVAAIPIFSGTKPWAQVPIQWSCRNSSGPDAEMEHLEFLHDDDSDPRRAFADSLYAAIGNTGSVITYSHFEKTVLRKLAEEFPEYKERFRQVESRIWDLYTDGVKRIFTIDDPAFNGSLSIKNVVRALIPTLRYDTLTIKSGDDAMKAWQELIQMPAGPERTKLRHDLSEYCGMDTLAMVGILGKLRSKIIIN